MNKSLLCITAAFLLFSFVPAQLKASTNPVPTWVTMTTVVEPTKSETLIARQNEIKAIDKTTLNASERKDLRKESRSIKRELKQLNGGVYLSAGAIILIVILLIVLL